MFSNQLQGTLYVHIGHTCGAVLPQCGDAPRGNSHYHIIALGGITNRTAQYLLTSLFEEHWKKIEQPKYIGSSMI
jgi:hypothetical protein